MGKRRSILLVDETESDIDVFLDILGDDFDISVATDGPSAIELAIQERPDLILLDVMMPGMDGRKVCRRLKTNRSMASTPVEPSNTLVALQSNSDLVDATPVCSPRPISILSFDLPRSMTLGRSGCPMPYCSSRANSPMVNGSR